MTRPHWRPAYIGVGSNLDSPADQVRRAIDTIRNLPHSVLVSASGSYLSAPLGPADQPDFVNAVVALLTQTGAEDLLAALQQIETQQGRVRSGDKWGPRTLDLDLLAFSGEVTDGDGLTLPHPGIAERNFVLLPWREIAPHFHVPGLASVAELASRVSLTRPRIERID